MLSICLIEEEAMLKKIIVLFITMMMTASLCISCGTEKVKLTWAFLIWAWI